jgi:hypothetical protein
LQYDQIQSNRTYVLTAEFQLSGGGRFFDRIILEGQRGESPSLFPPTTAPAANPTPIQPTDGPARELLSLDPVPTLLARTRAELAASFDFAHPMRVSRAPDDST